MLCVYICYPTCLCSFGVNILGHLWSAHSLNTIFSLYIGTHVRVPFLSLYIVCAVFNLFIRPRVSAHHRSTFLSLYIRPHVCAVLSLCIRPPVISTPFELRFFSLYIRSHVTCTPFEHRFGVHISGRLFVYRDCLSLFIRHRVCGVWVYILGHVWSAHRLSDLVYILAYEFVHRFLSIY